MPSHIAKTSKPAALNRVAGFLFGRPLLNGAPNERDQVVIGHSSVVSIPILVDTQMLYRDADNGLSDTVECFKCPVTRRLKFCRQVHIWPFLSFR